jgi:hypothetical protein
MSSYLWDGHGMRGSLPVVTVKYLGATDTRGSRWKATLKRDSQTYTAMATFEDGPVAAFNALRRKHVDELGGWIVGAIGTIDPDTYAITCTMAA